MKMSMQTVLKQLLRLVVVFSLYGFTTSSAFAVDSAIVNMNADGKITNTELTSFNDKLSIFSKRHSSSDCDVTWNVYVTLTYSGKVQVEYRTRANEFKISIAPLVTDRSYSNLLSIGENDSKSNNKLITACGYQPPQIDIAIKRGQYRIACRNSLAKGYVISQQSSTNYSYTTYFSSKATLTSHTSSTCTYTGDITTKYSTPLASGTSTYNGSTTIALEDVSALTER